jgi:hypothetical protein
MFTALFLDADRQYSCAYFETDRTPLDEAQAGLRASRHVAADKFGERFRLRDSNPAPQRKRRIGS